MSSDIVVAAYIVDKGKVLLIDHKKLNKWLPVGGHIEKDETPDAALKREAKEELGIDIEFLQYPSPRTGNLNQYALPFFVNVHDISEEHKHYCLFYLCKTKSLEINPKKEELNGFKWFSEDELDDPRIPDSVKETCLEVFKLINPN